MELEQFLKKNKRLQPRSFVYKELIEEAVKKSRKVLSNYNDWVGLQAFILDEVVEKLPIQSEPSKAEQFLIRHICKRCGKLENLRHFLKEFEKKLGMKKISERALYDAAKKLEEKELFIFVECKGGSKILKVLPHPKLLDFYKEARGS